mmetsp:Transcript_19755/g.58304  ORF Transcript_19755/g.58304 Transcript_19755/m.58304 type:complete len:219 (+) Transcript_19755:1294-1950(+)
MGAALPGDARGTALRVGLRLHAPQAGRLLSGKARETPRRAGSYSRGRDSAGWARRSDWTSGRWDRHSLGICRTRCRASPPRNAQPSRTVGCPVPAACRAAAAAVDCLSRACAAGVGSARTSRRPPNAHSAAAAAPAHPSRSPAGGVRPLCAAVAAPTPSAPRGRAVTAATGHRPSRLERRCDARRSLRPCAGALQPVLDGGARARTPLRWTSRAGRVE